MDDTASRISTEPPRGRRPRPSRPHVIKFRVSQEEYDLLQAKAQEANTTLTALLRDHIHEARITPQDGMQCLTGLHRLRVNMEALLEWCRTYKGLAETALILGHLVALEREIARLTESLRSRA
jgi:hypothetical protein